MSPVRLIPSIAVATVASSCGSPARSPKQSAIETGPVSPALACPNLPSNSDADAPAVVLYERNPWLMAVGTDFPTVALWRDGLIVFIHEDGKKYEARQVTIPAADAARIADQVASWTRRVPAYTQVTSWTDATTVELVVHDGDAWRDMAIYGLTREGAPAPLEFEGSGFGTPVAHPEKRRVVPGHFMDAYRALLALRPKAGVAFQPVDIEVMFWGFDYARGEAVPWPEDVPAPPADAVPGEREPGDPISYSFVVSPKHLPALRRMLDVANAADPPRGIGFNGHKWTVHPLRRFRGQELIDRVLHCGHNHDGDGVRVQ